MLFNYAITSSKFRSSFKMANIKAVFKKGAKGFKENYRPINILPLVSKIFENYLQVIKNFFGYSIEISVRI